ncbi:MAG: 50S ribosomal protein L4, partial [Blastocatellia bacterium]|nr:50S ribosomal protein L4 [Blastocatellia bacterium]
KMRRGALRSALSERLREGNLIVVDEFEFENPKTKGFLEALGSLGLVENQKHAKTLVVDSLDNANLVLSSRNVQKTKVTNSFGLNIYDVIYHEKLLISKSAIEEIIALLDPAREGGKVAEETKSTKPKVEKEAKPETKEKPEAKKQAAPEAADAKPKKAPAKKKIKEDDNLLEIGEEGENK